MIPDTELPGNSVGSPILINIFEPDPGAYPSIVAGITLETTDTSVTPRVDEIEVFYVQSKTARASASYDMYEQKRLVLMLLHPNF